jgi:hypothetical protein
MPVDERIDWTEESTSCSEVDYKVMG